MPCGTGWNWSTEPEPGLAASLSYRGVWRSWSRTDANDLRQTAGRRPGAGGYPSIRGQIWAKNLGNSRISSVFGSSPWFVQAKLYAIHFRTVACACGGLGRSSGTTVPWLGMEPAARRDIGRVGGMPRIWADPGLFYARTGQFERNYQVPRWLSVKKTFEWSPVLGKEGPRTGQRHQTYTRSGYLDLHFGREIESFCQQSHPPSAKKPIKSHLQLCKGRFDPPTLPPPTFPRAGLDTATATDPVLPHAGPGSTGQTCCQVAPPSWVTSKAWCPPA